MTQMHTYQVFRSDQPLEKEEGKTEQYLPKRSRRLPTLAKAAKDCHGCDLYLRADQVVFGEGAPTARIMLVGEQPGDVEDRHGRPFIGPAGKLLRATLQEAGLSPNQYYITNAVKHFRWTKKTGKRRIHQKPGVVHIDACRPWLKAEQEAIAPSLIICLGVTAARSILEKTVTLKAIGYQFLPLREGCDVLILQHPSAILRLRDKGSRKQAVSELKRWFKKAKRRVY